MIFVRVDTPTTEQWQSWCASGSRKASEHWEDYGAGRPFQVSSALYKNFRRHLFDTFHGKCGYCEALVFGSQHGDIEHYRPKRAVTDEHDVPVRVGGHPHPGYFWLAYDATNLLLSCVTCNQYSVALSGSRLGKANRFPILGQRALNRQDVSAEQPLLLHPCIDDPAAHLELDRRTGCLLGRDRRGDVSIGVLGLNREPLPELRLHTYDNVALRINELRGAVRRGDRAWLARALKYLADHRSGYAPFAMAGRLAIDDRRTQLEELRSALREPRLRHPTSDRRNNRSGVVLRGEAREHIDLTWDQKQGRF